MAVSAKKIVVPVDGSDNSMRALRVAIDRARVLRVPIHVINVQMPISSGNVRMFVSQDMIARYYEEEAATALLPARELLEAADAPYEEVTRIGHPGQEVAAYADPESGDEIVMGSRGMSLLGNLVLGSIATKVIHAARVPVTVVK